MKESNPAGYSGTLLLKKLGIKEGMRVLLLDAPRGFKTLLKPLPSNVELITKADPPLGFVHLFVTSAANLREKLTDLYPQLEQNRNNLGCVAQENLRREDGCDRRCDPRGRSADGTGRCQGLKLMIRKEKRARS
jgi:hypothetical protein